MTQIAPSLTNHSRRRIALGRFASAVAEALPNQTHLEVRSHVPSRLGLSPLTFHYVDEYSSNQGLYRNQGALFAGRGVIGRYEFSEKSAVLVARMPETRALRHDRKWNAFATDVDEIAQQTYSYLDSLTEDTTLHEAKIDAALDFYFEASKADDLPSLDHGPEL